jgi:hypothetical protein
MKLFPQQVHFVSVQRRAGVCEEVLDERDATHRRVVGAEQSNHGAEIVRDRLDDGTLEQGSDPAG